MSNEMVDKVFIVTGASGGVAHSILNDLSDRAKLLAYVVQYLVLIIFRVLNLYLSILHVLMIMNLLSLP